MKQVFTYVLLLSLVIRPLFIAGHIAYYELNIDYITEKFCENKAKPQLQCNGKCHLAKELSVVALDVTADSGNEWNLISACKSFTPLFFKNHKPVSLGSQVSFSAHKKHFFYYNNNYCFNKEISLLRPPIV